MRVWRAPILLLLWALCTAHAQRDCLDARVEVAVAAGGGGQEGGVSLFYGYPAAGFGASLNESFPAGPAATLALPEPRSACGAVAPLAAAASGPVAGLVQRGNCSFLKKAQMLEAAGYAYMILFGEEPGCVFMSSNETGATLRITAVSVSRSAGEEMQAAAGGGGATVRLRAPLLPADYSPLGLWAAALGTLAGGAAWAGADLRRQLQGGGGGARLPGGSKGGEAPEAVHVTTQAAAAFVFVSSAVLLLLFFFFSEWLTILVTAVFALATWAAAAAVLRSLLGRCAPAPWHAARVAVPLPPRCGGGPHPALDLAAALLAGAASVTWLACRSARWAWVLQDGLNICLMLLTLRQIHLPNLKVACILLPLAFVYDVWWVFIQPAVFGGESVMVAVATGAGSGQALPMLLAFPRASLGSNPGYSILGLGDVVLPGLLAAFAARWDVARGLGWARGYAAPCCVAYSAGLVATWAALAYSLFGDEGQPALLYLVPCTLGTVLALAAARGDLRRMWAAEPPGAEAAGGGEAGGLEADSLLEDGEPSSAGNL